MSIISNISFDFGNQNNFYFSLLKEEDFNFKTKDIHFKIEQNKKINVTIECKSVLELKIATTALIKSLEIINKTLEV